MMLLIVTHILLTFRGKVSLEKSEIVNYLLLLGTSWDTQGQFTSHTQPLGRGP